MYRRSIYWGRCAPSYAPTAHSYALAADPAGTRNPPCPTAPQSAMSHRARAPRGVSHIYSQQAHRYSFALERQLRSCRTVSTTGISSTTPPLYYYPTACSPAEP
ncbi:hypothetical protein BT67DRAFT_229892 [Trichocladium antarcticum]|uniref:Uncharacterized protein n=1 Tax=Trichocladium antarcticum TaxID=1450529 RepID=A0AAN6UNN1_9PEZI|nr:hypothetical protein BT67DRAFT_229892 [Trichocladium antarcticum]